MDDMLARLGFALAIALGGWLLYAAWRRWRLARLHSPQLGLESWRGEGPAILYFTTPDCVPCKTQQRPELHKLTHALGVEVQIIQVDATQQPNVADYWGVLSVPTTFVINARGQACAMNPGVASAEKLRSQLLKAELAPEPAPAEEAGPRSDATLFVKYQGRIE